MKHPMSTCVTPNHSVCSRDSEPKSRAQDIFYSANWANGSSDPLIQEHGHPRLVSSRGHAPPSTAQFKMYPLRYTEQVKEEEVVVPDESEHADCPKIEFSSYMKYRDNFTFLGMYMYRNTFTFTCIIIQAPLYCFEKLHTVNEPNNTVFLNALHIDSREGLETSTNAILE